ncbi:MAG: phosphatidate cytidylyltransferase [Sporomusaceae bacterium]|nr:phosphatidate cytidylyltransferase [Sporomusaceae bacterium]
MLGKRILTALIGMAYTVWVVNYGQWPYVLTILLITLLAWHEYCRMLLTREIRCNYWLGAFTVFLLPACAWLGNSSEMIGLLTCVNLLSLAHCILFREKCAISDVAFTILGISYIGLTFSHLILLRFYDERILCFGSLTYSTAYLWLAFLGTWASDTFAYFIGSRFGKHKLCPAISLSKTIEGSIGGVCGSLLVVLSFSVYIGLPWLHSLAMGILVGVMAPLGDLAESAIKRFAQIKDSGTILPGHGGILDRFDSILFAVPAVYYYVIALLG